jgi:hypothetical protein
VTLFAIVELQVVSAQRTPQSRAGLAAGRFRFHRRPPDDQAELPSSVENRKITGGY